MSDEQRADPRFYPDNREPGGVDKLLPPAVRAGAGGLRRAIPSSSVQQRRRAPPMVERAGEDAGVRPPAHRGRERPRPQDAADALPPPRELLDATPDGIRLIRDGVLRVDDKVRLPVLGIDTEDREEGVGDRTSPQ
jgi:hypothetical protein